MNNKTKKLRNAFLIAGFCLFNTFSYGQTKEESKDATVLSKEIFEIQIQITNKLNNIENRNRGGSYGGKKMSDWHYVYGIEKNKALYEFFYYNEDKNDFDYRYRIDLSKIGNISMGTTNAGDDGFFFFAKQGESAIQKYIKSNDWDFNIGAPSYRNDEWVQQATILMPQDQDLLDLFREARILIEEHKNIKSSEYGSLKDVEYFQNPVAANNGAITKEDPSLNKYFIAPKTQQEKIADLSTEVGSFLGGIASQIEANRLETERKEAYKAAKIVVAGKKASIIIDEYLSSAEQGNERSIIMVSEAYRSMDDVSTNYNDRGENIKDRKDLKFLESINSKFYSPAAIESLLYLYNLQINYYKEGRKKERGKALSRILLGGAIIGGVILAGTDIAPLISTAGVLGGGILASSGGVHAIMITSYSKKSPVYQYAIIRIKQLERRKKDKINAVEEVARLAEEERVRLAEIAEEARLKDLRNVGFAAFRVGYVTPTSEESQKLSAVPIYLANGLPHYGGEFTPYANPYTKGQFGLETGFSAGFTGIINLEWLNKHMPSRIGFGIPLDMNFAMMKYSWEGLGTGAGKNAFLYTDAKYGFWGVLSGGIGLSLTIRPAKRFYIDFIARPDFYLTTGGKYTVEGANGTRNYSIETVRDDNSSGMGKTFGVNIRYKRIMLAFEMKQEIVEKENFTESVKVTESSGTTNNRYDVKPSNLNLDYMQMTLGFVF